MSDFRSIGEGLQEALGSEEPASRAKSRKSSGTNASEWLVNVADDVVVPMITSEVVEALRAGRLSNRSLVWRIGMHDWSALAEVPQLRLAAGPSALRGSVRPPVPASLPPLSTPISSPRLSAPALADDAGALAVYDRPAASLTFSEAAHADWHGTARPSQPPVPAALRLTPVPPVPSRLALHKARSLPPNTLAPTTAEADSTAAARTAAWGDRSVVLASELRAVKKTSRRVLLWSAVGSAAVASLFTFWISRAPALRADAPATPAVAAAPHLAEPEKIEAAAVAPPVVTAQIASAAPAISAAPVVSAASTPPVLTAKVTKVVHAVKRAKPVVPAEIQAPPAAAADTDSATEPADDGANEAKPSVAETLPLAAPAPSEAKPAAPAQPAASAQPVTPSVPQPAPASPGP